MPTQIGQAFSVKNLRRCWGWICANPESAYKNYFRDIYSAYELGLEKNLSDLSKRLRDGAFQPRHASKLYFPKGSGLLRPWSLLTVEDQIAYQAAASIVAAKLYPRVRRRYWKSIFGNLYAGKNSTFFYHDWRRSYRRYTQAMRSAYGDGNDWTASFDLTACYDSLDHRVLRDRLTIIGIEKEVCDLLLRWLCHWSVHRDDTPVFVEHGIPQGPLASGIISEVVLSHFDMVKSPVDVVYTRYVDDIRLFAPTEQSLRRHLITLDLASKEIGLFPQSSKIAIHEVNDIEDEVKSISRPPEELYDETDEVDQVVVNSRIQELTDRLLIRNETRFKFVLAHALPNAKLGIRLLKLLRRYPHLHGSICRHLEKSPTLAKSVSKDALKLLRSYDLYPSFTASMIRMLHNRVHSNYRASLTKYCQSRLAATPAITDPELFASVASVVIASGSTPWNKVEKYATWDRSFWVRTQLLRCVRIDLVGKASAGTLANKLLRDSITDVAVVAAGMMLEHGLILEKPFTDANLRGQHALREAKVIGRVTRAEDPIAEKITDILGRKVSGIEWKTILGSEYRETIGKVVRWHAYSRTDATSWTNLSDTLMDIVLNKFVAHDGTIGGYTLGGIGSFVGSSTSRFARKYPSLRAVADEIHTMRLESDLSHPVTRSTSRPTKYIRHKQMLDVIPRLADGWAEMWANW